MNQIVLITDGRSNVGVSPAVAAAHAYREGIVVNVVGVVDDGDIDGKGADEIAEIARSGGGISRIVNSALLAQTVQMVTRKTVVGTIHQVVNRELRQLLGGKSLADLPPEQRGPIVQAIDDWSEQVSLRVALLIDTSGSMKRKLRAVEQACRDFLYSLQARKGESEMAVFHFPGDRTDTEMDVGWTRDLAKTQGLFYNLNMKGTTPTGPALLDVVRYFGADVPDLDEFPRGRDGNGVRAVGQDGVWRDYIV